MSFGELVLDMRLNADEDKENISENTMTQTDEILIDQNQPKWVFRPSIPLFTNTVSIEILY